jgi:arylsulfatase A-like enzyme
MVPGWNDTKVDLEFTKKAIDFIRNGNPENPGQPFFLYLATACPHRPCVPPDFLRGKSRAGIRGDAVVEFDWIVGQVVETLEELDIRDNTLLIVTSDNGARPGDGINPMDLKFYHGTTQQLKEEELGEEAMIISGHGPEKWATWGHKSCGDLKGYKADIWEGGHRVPFIASWPGRITAGTVNHQTICQTDIFAAVAELVGFDLPDATAEDSYNILPLFLGKAGDKPVRDATVHHSSRGVFAIRRGNWKLIRGLGSGGFTHPGKIEHSPGMPEGQLYNLDEDPAETNNLYNDKPEKVEELLKLLGQLEEAS